jgi:hypothetical protein
MRVMTGCRIGRLPLLDEAGRLVGVVTLGSAALRSPKGAATPDTAHQDVTRGSERG